MKKNVEQTTTYITDKDKVTSQNIVKHTPNKLLRNSVHNSKGEYAVNPCGSLLFCYLEIMKTVGNVFCPLHRNKRSVLRPPPKVIEHTTNEQLNPTSHDRKEKYVLHSFVVVTLLFLTLLSHDVKFSCYDKLFL